jgi:anthranilate synthase/aminodeoxychorismate synthase-like glutamine amidotransferase
VFDEVIDSASAWSATEARPQLCKIVGLTGGNHFHVAIFCVAHPAAHLELRGFAVDEPAKSNPLHAALNKEMENHSTQSTPVLQMCAAQCNRVARIDLSESDRHALCGVGMFMRNPSAELSIPNSKSAVRRATLGSAMVFVLDNYDSFTYNLVQYLGELGAEVIVRRNDELSLEQVEALRPDRILLSPGPCTPHEAGILVPLIRHMAGKVPILGVCLGHQAIGEAFGGKVVRAHTLMHGKTSAVDHDGKGVFTGLPTPLTCTRYHSLIVDEGSLPSDLTVTARSSSDSGAESVIMGVRHRNLPIEGVQFHPESVLTEGGHQMIRNFLGA